jgi:hypothetical protein
VEPLGGASDTAGGEQSFEGAQQVQIVRFHFVQY